MYTDPGDRPSNVVQGDEIAHLNGTLVKQYEATYKIRHHLLQAEADAQPAGHLGKAPVAHPERQRPVPAEDALP
mgnify:CR=1 FL=1